MSTNEQREKGRNQRGLCWLGALLQLHHASFPDALAFGSAQFPFGVAEDITRQGEWWGMHPDFASPLPFLRALWGIQGSAYAGT